MAMLAVWMTRAVHMKGRKVRMVAMTSGLLVNSAGKNITMQPAGKAMVLAPQFFIRQIEAGQLEI